MIATAGYIRAGETQHIIDRHDFPSPYSLITSRDWIQIIIDYWIWINDHLRVGTLIRMGRRCPGRGRCDKERDYG